MTRLLRRAFTAIGCLNSLSARPTCTPRHVINEWLRWLRRSWVLNAIGRCRWLVSGDPLGFQTCDKRVTKHCCAWIAHWGRSIVLPFLVIKEWPISQVTLLVFVCFFIWPCLSFQRIKGWEDSLSLFLIPLFPPPFLQSYSSINVVPNFLPVFVPRGCLRTRRGGVYGAGRGSLLACVWNKLMRPS